MANNSLQNENNLFRGMKFIPLVIRWTAGAPAIVANPMNEIIALTDNGNGDVSLTLADASKAPLMVAGAMGLGASNSAKINSLNLQVAPTTTVVRLLFQEVTIAAANNVSAAAADPVDVHVALIKFVEL